MPPPRPRPIGAAAAAGAAGVGVGLLLTGNAPCCCCCWLARSCCSRPGECCGSRCRPAAAAAPAAGWRPAMIPCRRCFARTASISCKGQQSGGMASSAVSSHSAEQQDAQGQWCSVSTCFSRAARRRQDSRTQGSTPLWLPYYTCRTWLVLKVEKRNPTPRSCSHARPACSTHTCRIWLGLGLNIRWNTMTVRSSSSAAAGAPNTELSQKLSDVSRSDPTPHSGANPAHQQ